MKVTKIGKFPNDEIWIIFARTIYSLSCLIPPFFVSFVSVSINMGRFLCFSVSLILTQIIFPQTAAVNRWMGINCTASNITVTNYSCFVKNYGEWNTTLNGEGFIKKPISHLSGSYEIGFSKDIRGPYNVFLKHSFEKLCDVLGSALKFPVVVWALDKIGGSLNSLIHPCPYEVGFDIFEVPVSQSCLCSQGLIKVENVWHVDDPLSTFPIGFYRGPTQRLQRRRRKHLHYRLRH